MYDLLPSPDRPPIHLLTLCINNGPSSGTGEIQLWISSLGPWRRVCFLVSFKGVTKTWTVCPNWDTAEAGQQMVGGTHLLWE